jgi:hypothetical protein
MGRDVDPEGGMGEGGRAVYFGNAWTPGSLWYISNGVSSRILSFLKKEKI